MQNINLQWFHTVTEVDDACSQPWLLVRVIEEGLLILWPEGEH